MEALTLDLSGIAAITDDELFILCQGNRDVRIERASTGELLLMAPTGGVTSSRNHEINRQLGNWNKEAKSGVAFDSSGGFILPNNAMRAPDAAWIAITRWNSLTVQQQRRFPPLCPDFVVELLSETDRLETAQEKMEEWIANGCRLAWLIDPGSEQVHIYRAHGEVGSVEGFDNTVSGEDVLPGFELELRELQ
jgi:Uma2 family endonuclease